MKKEAEGEGWKRLTEDEGVVAADEGQRGQAVVARVGVQGRLEVSNESADVVLVEGVVGVNHH